MKHISKIIFVALLLTAFSNSSYSQTVIEITLNPNGTDIVLSNVYIDPSDGLETTDLGSFFARDVVWRITDPRIQSITITPKNVAGTYPFTNALNPAPATQISKEVILGIVWLRNLYWKYNINWTTTLGARGTHDPKIAVKPGRTLVSIFALLAAIFGAFFIRKSILSKRNNNNQA